jgi:FAD:protein FMN transferase
VKRVRASAIAWGTLLLTLAGAIAWLSWLRSERLVLLEASIPSIMGTQTTLKAVVRGAESARGQDALHAAENALRAVEAAMSVWVGSSELSAFNRALPGQIVALSPATLAVIKAALDLTRTTDGAFDATCRPLLEAWRLAEADHREPTTAELAAARDRVGSQHVQLHPDGAEKLRAGIQFDLGGLAKGYAVDQAVEAMQAAGALGGLVQCGGDLRVFGRTDHHGPWRIALQDPASPASAVLPHHLDLAQGAVSTSGNSRRGYTIAGRRRSHIIDPRTGWPCDDVPQVTVLASNALVSDGWSTALTVLGSNGLARLPRGVEALLCLGPTNRFTLVSTPGFPR